MAKSLPLASCGFRMAPAVDGVRDARSACTATRPRAHSTTCSSRWWPSRRHPVADAAMGPSFRLGIASSRPSSHRVLRDLAQRWDRAISAMVLLGGDRDRRHVVAPAAAAIDRPAVGRRGVSTCCPLRAPLLQRPAGLPRGSRVRLLRDRGRRLSARLDGISSHPHRGIRRSGASPPGARLGDRPPSSAAPNGAVDALAQAISLRDGAFRAPCCDAPRNPPRELEALSARREPATRLEASQATAGNTVVRRATPPMGARRASGRRTGAFGGCAAPANTVPPKLPRRRRTSSSIRRPPRTESSTPSDPAIIAPRQAFDVRQGGHDRRPAIDPPPSVATSLRSLPKLPRERPWSRESCRRPRRCVGARAHEALASRGVRWRSRKLARSCRAETLRPSRVVRVFRSDRVGDDPASSRQARAGHFLVAA